MTFITKKLLKSSNTAIYFTLMLQIHDLKTRFKTYEVSIAVSYFYCFVYTQPVCPEVC